VSDTSAAGGWELLEQNRPTIIEGWVAAASRSLAGRMTLAELQRDVDEMFESMVAAGESGSHQASAEGAGPLRALLADLARTRARQGFSPTETAVSVFAVKEAVLAVLEAEGDAEAYRFFAEFSRFVDDVGLLMLETYSQAREQVISEQADALLELSTPVVKLWDGIVCLPLVGTLDSARTQVVMEKLLQALVDTGSEHAIIDITGVSAVDTQVAQHLLKTVMAARLLGADCIISGIRPQIAQTVVALGIEFGDVSTKASLADAMLLALRRSGSDVVRRPAAGSTAGTRAR
jgi:rsbT co-antagonist protein RsbR